MLSRVGGLLTRKAPGFTLSLTTCFSSSFISSFMLEVSAGDGVPPVNEAELGNPPTRSDMERFLRNVRRPFEFTKHTEQIAVDCSRCGSPWGVIISSRDGSTTCRRCEHHSTFTEFQKEELKRVGDRNDAEQPLPWETSANLGELDADLYDDHSYAQHSIKLQQKQQKNKQKAKEDAQKLAQVVRKIHPDVEAVWKDAIAYVKLWPPDAETLVKELGLDGLSLHLLHSCGIRMRVVPGELHVRMILPRFGLANRTTPMSLKIVWLEESGLKKTLVPRDAFEDSARRLGVFSLGVDAGGKDSAVLVRHERDALALFSAVNLPIFVIPHPSDATIIPFLEDYDKLYLWWPEKERDAAHSMARLLGPKRSRVVVEKRPVEVLRKDPKGAALRNTLGKAEKRPVHLEECKSFSQIKVDACDELVNGRSRSTGIARFTRFPILDEYLGGLRPGEMTVLTGPTGVGKTTFLSELTVDFLTQGVRTLMCSLEMREERVLATMMKQFAFRSLTDPAIARAYADRLERAKGDLLFLKAVECEAKSVGKIAQIIENQVVSGGVQLVVVDNLQFLVGLASIQGSGGHFEKIHAQDNFVRDLRQLVTRTGVHLILVVHPRKTMNDGDPIGIQTVGGSVRVTQEADTILVLQPLPPKEVRRQYKEDIAYEKIQDAEKESQVVNGRPRNYLRILKNRYMGHLVTDFRLAIFFDPNHKTHTIEDGLPSNVKRGAVAEI